MLGQFSIFAPGAVARTTMEMQPLLSPAGKFSLFLAWGNFTTSFFIGFISLLFLLVYYVIIKRDSAEKNLLVVWSLIIFLAMIGQRRFAYYFVVNAALLSGYLSWQFLRLIYSKSKGLGPAITYLNTALAVIIVFFAVFFWNIKPAMAIAQQARFAPSDAWVSSLTWLKENSPAPFGNDSFYYEIYEPPPPDKTYNYPDSAYGVTAWWDYGYWIMRIAHRLPNTNPGGLGRVPTAQFFLSQSEELARQSIQKLKATLEQFIPRVEQVVAQTKRRVFEGEKVPASEKIVSIFEPHTAIICRGKANKPVEFGRKVWLDEVEGGIVSDYRILDGNPPDSRQWKPSLAHHVQLFGRPPYQASADRGVYSASNEAYAEQVGVKRVILPKPGYKSEARRQHERQRWFKRGRRFHAGVEGRISVLKRKHGLDRCLYHGDDGFGRWVGWGVIAGNLAVMGTALAARRADDNDREKI